VKNAPPNQSAQQLLGFVYHPEEFARRGAHAFTQDARNRMERATRELGRLGRSAEAVEAPSEDGIRAAHTRFRSLSSGGLAELRRAFSTRRQVSNLVWALCYRPPDGPPITESRKQLTRALAVIDERFRPGHLPGLFVAVLQTWGHDSSNPDRLRTILAKRLAGYSGRRQLLTQLKRRADLFTGADGPAKLAARMDAEGIPLSDVCEHVGIAPDMITYRYFGSVAVAYAALVSRQRNIAERVGQIMEFLARHRELDVAKQVFATLVPPLRGTAPAPVREALRHSSLSLIGDPGHEFRWGPWSGASGRERRDLSLARECLNEWVSQHLLQEFFRHIAINRERAAFWLKYTEHMPNVKIYADSWSRRRLLASERLAPYADTRIGRLIGGGQQSALLIETRDHILVEFSLPGAAFYAYSRENPRCPDATAGQHHISKLRQPSVLGRQITATHMPPQGRVFHHARWQSTLAAWLSRYVT
jgi:hypothetical protein